MDRPKLPANMPLIPGIAKFPIGMPELPKGMPAIPSSAKAKEEDTVKMVREKPSDS